MKLSDNPDVPTLKGWVNITEAAEMLGITRQHSYKKATQFGRPGGWNTLHRVGTQPAYVVAVSEIEELKRARDEREARRAADEATAQEESRKTSE